MATGAAPLPYSAPAPKPWLAACTAFISPDPTQPLPCFWQHQFFLSVDQPFTKFSKPAVQSYSAAGTAAQLSPGPGQPFLCTLQHHCFFCCDHPAFQFSSPSAQLKGSTGPGCLAGLALGRTTGQPMPTLAQHCACLFLLHLYCQFAWSV